MSFNESTLGQVLEFYNGKTIKPGGVGVYPVYGSNGLIGGSDEWRIENALIIGRVGANCGSIMYCPTKFWASDNTIISRPIEQNSDIRYFYYLLQCLQLNKYAGGAAQPLVTQTVLKQVPVHVASPPIQRRIAAILSAYDDLIENNTRRIAILEEMARRIYEEWFVDFRVPGHESVHLVESELGLVPVGWDTLRLDEVCSRITDGSHTSPKSVDSGLPMASVKDMHDWGVNINSCRKIAEDDYQKLVRNDCKPKLGDILIAKDGSYLKHTFVVDEEVDLVILSSIAILRPNGRFLANQLALYLQLPEIMSRMKGYVSGVAIPRIVLRDFRQFLVLVPPAEIQRNWSEKCDPMLSLCRKLVRKNANLRATRDLLLPRLISGELDVSTLPIPKDIVV